MPRRLTIQQACKILDVSERTFRRMIAAGEFPKPLRCNKRWVRVLKSDIEEFLKRLEQQRHPGSA
jgi:excisionase family DNA binding protein